MADHHSLVERLRENAGDRVHTDGGSFMDGCGLCDEAADRIEQLERENEQYNEAVQSWLGRPCGGDCLAAPCALCDGTGFETEGERRELIERAERAERELAEASILMLGGTYLTQGGNRVTMVKIHGIGTPYETLEDEQGVHRYSRRISDMGRATGTAHDYSDPLNIQRPIRAIALRRQDG